MIFNQMIYETLRLSLKTYNIHHNSDFSSDKHTKNQRNRETGEKSEKLCGKFCKIILFDNAWLVLLLGQAFFKYLSKKKLAEPTKPSELAKCFSSLYVESKRERRLGLFCLCMNKKIIIVLGLRRISQLFKPRSALSNADFSLNNPVQLHPIIFLILSKQNNLSYLYDHVTMSIAAIERTIFGYHDNLAILSNFLNIFLTLAENTMIL